MTTCLSNRRIGLLHQDCLRKMNCNIIRLVHLYNWLYDFIRLITAGVVYNKQHII